MSPNRNTPMLACPDRQTLAAFAVGDRPSAELDEIGDHLDTCANCRKALETIEFSHDPLVTAVQSGRNRFVFTDEPECSAALAAIAEFCAPPSVPARQVPLGMIREYELLNPIGAGGMGTVYRALHTRLNRIVALKVLPAERFADPQAVARFRQEMRAIGQLDHPHIVRAFDAGEHERTHYLVLEYIDGIDLSTLSHRCGPLPVADACELIRQAALGLDYAHRRHLVHRDIKPSNLLLTPDGQVKILDFGLALLRGDHMPQENLTTDGQVMGTLDYMAPEQIQDTHGVDIRADLYSLGCTLFKLLTGETPFGGPQYRTLYQKMQAHTMHPPPSISQLRPDVPPALAALVNQLLAKSPDQRIATPAQLLEAIAPFAAGADLPRLMSRSRNADENTFVAPALSGSSVPAGSHPADTTAIEARPPALATAIVEPVAAPSPDAAVPRAPKRTRSWLLAGAGLVALGAVIVISTGKGTVTITQPDAVADQVEIVLRSGGEEVAVMDKSNHWTVTVRNGDYDIAVRGGSDQFQVKEGKLSVKRFGKSLVEVEAKGVAAATSDHSARRVAEWVLSLGGQLSIIADGKEQLMSQIGELPFTPFILHKVALANLGIKVTDAELQRFADAPQLADTISINLNGAELLSDEGLAVFARLKLRKLRELGLAHTPKLSGAGLRHLSGLEALEQLSLDGSGLADAGLVHLHDLPKLKLVDVRETKVTAEGVRKLSQRLPNCRIVSDFGTFEPTKSDTDLDRRVAAAVLERGGDVHIWTVRSEGKRRTITTLAQLPDGPVSVSAIRFGPSLQVSDELLRDVIRLPALTWADFQNSGLTSEQLGVVAQRPSLTGLILHNCRNITDTAAQDLLKFTSLELLDVAGTLLTDRGLAGMQRLTRLTQLDLRSTKVTAPAVESLHKALPNCRIASDFGTFEPTKSDTDRRAAERELALWVVRDRRNGESSGLVEIRFANGSSGSIAVAGEVPSADFRVVGVRPDQPFADGDFARLGRHTTLESIEGSHLAHSQLTGAALRHIAGLSALRSLGIRGAKLVDSDLQALDTLSALRELRVVDTGLTDAAFIHLERHPKLEVLDASANRITDKGVERIVRCSALKRLELHFTPITGRGLETIADSLSLESLGVGGTRVKNNGFQAICRMTHLRKLHCPSGFLTTGALAPISSLRNLQFLDLSSNAIGDADVAKLGDLKNLEQVYVSHTQITDASLKTLAALPLLTELGITQTGITDAGLAELAGCRRLRELQLTKTRVTKAGVERLRRDLPQCRIVSDFGTFNPGTVAPAPSFALQFDGIDDHVEIPTLRYDGTHPITIEAWVTAQSAETVHRHILGNGPLALGLFFSGEKSWFFDVDPARNYYVASVGNTQLQRKTHIAGVVEGRNTRLYVDGVQQRKGGVPPAGIPAWKDGFFIGCELVKEGRPAALERFFHGVIDEIRISSVARYRVAGNFTPVARFEPDEHTLALYHFDEGTGDILHDASGRGHNGKIVGATWVKQGVEPTGTTSEPDRRVAEAILGANGKVTIVIPEAPPESGARQSYSFGFGLPHELPLKGHERLVQRIEDLPADAFFVTRVQIRHKEPLDPATVEQLRNAKYLFELNLEGSSLDDSHAPLLGELGQLRHLNVGMTSVTDAGLRHLSRLKDLQDLGAHRLPGISDAGLEHIARLTELKGLSLSTNDRITDRGVAALRPLKKLMWLWLPETGVTDAALETVAEFKDLDSICLYKTRITGSGLVHLSRIPRLNWLLLSNTLLTDENGVLLRNVPFGSLEADHTGIGDRTLEAIAGHKIIHRLALAGTNITDAGLAHLAGARINGLYLNSSNLTGTGLRDLTVTGSLVLKGNKVTDEAARFLAKNETLQAFDISQTQVSKETVQFLIAALPKCQIVSNFGTFEPAKAENDIDHRSAEWVLSLGGKVTVAVEGTEREIKSESDLPAGNFSLTGVVLSENRTVTDEALVPLRNCRRLERLELSQTQISDAGLVHLKECTRLVTLDVSLTRITGDGLAQLQELAGLKILALLGTRMTDRSIPLLHAFTKLEGLNLIGTEITDAAIPQLVKLSSVSSLRLEKTKITAAGLETLRKGLPNCRIVSDHGTIEPGQR